MSSKNSTVVVIAPHPDDETLGVGGTLLKHRQAGDPVYWVVLTHVNEDPNFSERFKKERAQQMEQVALRYGFARTLQLPYGATKLDAVPRGAFVEQLAGVIREVEPEVLYIPNRSDVHSDHQVAFEVSMACCKTFRYPFIREVLMYETLSETDAAAALPERAFLPNVFVDITDHLETKLKIMSLYASEVQPHPFPRSLESLKALALLRGSQAAVKYAEGFMLLKSRR